MCERAWRGAVLAVALAVALAPLSAVAGATALRLQSSKSALAIGERFELSLWLDLSASSTTLGVNAAGATLSWDASVVDLDIVGAQPAVRDFISTPTSAVVLAHGVDAYHLAAVHYDAASGFATFALGLLAARGAYSADAVSSSVVPCADSGCGRFDLATLRLRVLPLIPTEDTAVPLSASAPRDSQSPYGAASDSSATVILGVATSSTVLFGALIPGGGGVEFSFAPAWELASLSLSWQPSAISLSYTVLDDQRLQLSLPGQSGLVDAAPLLVQVTDGQYATTLALTVAVVADRLRLVPSSATVTAASTFALSIEGIDVYGNLDLDYRLSPSATLAVDPVAASVVAALDPQRGGFTLSGLWAPVEGPVQLSVADGALSGAVVVMLQSTATQLQLRLGSAAPLVVGSSFTVIAVGVDDHNVQDLDFVWQEPFQLEIAP